MPSLLIACIDSTSVNTERDLRMESAGRRIFGSSQSRNLEREERRNRNLEREEREEQEAREERRWKKHPQMGTSSMILLRLH